MQEVAVTLPSVFVKFHRGLREYQLITQTRRNWKTKFIGSGDQREVGNPDGHGRVFRMHI